MLAKTCIFLYHMHKHKAFFPLISETFSLSLSFSVTVHVLAICPYNCFASLWCVTGYVCIQCICIVSLYSLCSALQIDWEIFLRWWILRKLPQRRQRKGKMRSEMWKKCLLQDLLLISSAEGKYANTHTNTELNVKRLLINYHNGRLHNSLSN